MPGSSLWLIPPPNTPFNRSLNTWITATVPFRFSPSKPPAFIPHVTLTSNIPFSLHDTKPTDAQVWLDCLELPLPAADAPDDEKIVVDLAALEAGEPFFKKLTLKVADNLALDSLAIACRAQGVYSGDFERGRTWAKTEYQPHLSVMYADMPRKEAESKIPALLQDFDRAKSIFKPTRDGTVAIGGSVVLVPTDKEIDQWKPIARREVPGLVWKYNVM
ncbi:2, 3 cyclic phosphodiesterase [Myriangium duriaei CBS 260.36]|uniref:2, 3 cyclic phosphodiesterase n=1 Tax=Myriangium duriaei CBS 260.36 TaxID=1168546 RepID=A0A9P4MGW8_9PEZI|nr:2, 3 cyclic phosphodiesterase [Myriangium duriaei CBS 260.36]